MRAQNGAGAAVPAPRCTPAVLSVPCRAGWGVNLSCVRQESQETLAKRLLANDDAEGPVNRDALEAFWLAMDCYGWEWLVMDSRWTSTSPIYPIRAPMCQFTPGLALLRLNPDHWLPNEVVQVY